MAWRDEHEDDCNRLLGYPWSEVHYYLDELAKKYPVGKYLEYHRRFRHNKKGVAYCREEWGEEAAKAAKIHIVRDWFGWMEHLDLKEVLEIADRLLLKLHVEEE